jgi:hypothetical protein
MAFSQGNPVITYASLNASQEAFAANGIPLVGTVESDVAGNCIVCWANGTRTTVPNDGASSLTLLKSPSPTVAPFYHQRVQIIPALGISNLPANANGQGASQGLVIGVFTLGDDTDMVVVEFTGGDIWTIALAGVFAI